MSPAISPIAVALSTNASTAREYPDVLLELTTTEESRLDLVGAGFDAGIHLGEFVERDMVAVRVSREQRAAIVAARRVTSHRTRNQNRRGIYRLIVASTSDTARTPGQIAPPLVPAGASEMSSP